MIFSQGLLISLAFTSIIAILLFFYVRQRTNAVENKINTLIQFVQTETMKLQTGNLASSRDMQIYEQTEENTLDNNVERIDVSDDSDSESDSESESDNDSEYSSTSGSDIMESTRIISMNNLVKENENESDIIELNVIKPDIEYENAEISYNLEADLEALTLTDNSDEETHTEETHTDEPSTDHLVNTTITNDFSVNYRKMLVSELRTIVQNKGLAEDTKKLKKNDLLKLLSV